MITLYLLYYKSSGELESEKDIFYNAANNIQDHELYLSEGYIELNLLERNWKKYDKKANKIVEISNNKKMDEKVKPLFEMEEEKPEKVTKLDKLKNIVGGQFKCKKKS